MRLFSIKENGVTSQNVFNYFHFFGKLYGRNATFQLISRTTSCLVRHGVSILHASIFICFKFLVTNVNLHFQ